SLPAQVIVRRIYREPVQPGLKNLGRAKLIQGKIQSQKNFLGHIFHVLRPRDQPGDRAQNPLTVGQYDVVKSGSIARLSAPDYVEINQHAAPYEGRQLSRRTGKYLGYKALREKAKATASSFVQIFDTIPASGDCA